MLRRLSIVLVLSSLLLVEAFAQGQSSDPPSEPGLLLAAAALERTSHRVAYDGAYRRIAYPGGDVADDRGVCTDVVVRSYRALGIDLQQLVHEDMARDFSAYPAHWGLGAPDTNIDHRRVPNIRRFLERRGAELPVSGDPEAFKPGDIVSWNLTPGGFLPHIGIISSRLGDQGVPLVVHNIGAGPQLEDALFAWQITGHYRFLNWPQSSIDIPWGKADGNTAIFRGL
jgi:hypothetical protein